MGAVGSRCSMDEGKGTYGVPESTDEAYRWPPRLSAEPPGITTVTKVI